MRFPHKTPQERAVESWQPGELKIAKATHKKRWGSEFVAQVFAWKDEGKRHLGTAFEGKVYKP
ncbi:MAG: hypothetical protein JWP52_4091, partial [Rhizobacter sp.]|nr:hypothetical protein [Rhizobacter sp.]